MEIWNENKLEQAMQTQLENFPLIKLYLLIYKRNKGAFISVNLLRVLEQKVERIQTVTNFVYAVDRNNRKMSKFWFKNINKVSENKSRTLIAFKMSTRSKTWMMSNRIQFVTDIFFVTFEVKPEKRPATQTFTWRFQTPATEVTCNLQITRIPTLMGLWNLAIGFESFFSGDLATR